jgi:RNA polymerase sigma-70 factor (ECF subfamily)
MTTKSRQGRKERVCRPWRGFSVLKIEGPALKRWASIRNVERFRVNGELGVRCFQILLRMQTKPEVGGVLIMKDREEVMENVATHENWRSCFVELGPGLLLFARQWVHSAADAEDIVQEAFVKFWRRKHQIDPPSVAAATSGVASNRGLLYAIVRSTALDFIRRDSRRARRERTALADAEESIEPVFEFEDETQVALAAALDRLPHDQREVVVMKIWNELTFAEIGQALGISQNTAASRYRYALAGLKRTLQPQ